MRILFIDGTEGHNPHLTKTKPTGGILTSLTYIPEYLVKQGHEVFVQSTYEYNETINGVHYLTADSKIERWDVTVFNRNVLPREYALWHKDNGIKMVWWLHDIVDTRYLKDNTFMLMDKIVALSNYCKDTYSDFYNIDPNKFAVIPNGVDKTLWYPGVYKERNPNLYIMASAPLKGSLPVDLTYQTLIRHFPDLDFRIYSNQSLHQLKNKPEHDAFLRYMKHLGAHVYQPVSQDVLAHLFRQAWCLIMPGNYPEICSNLVLQARACGLPISMAGIGANTEFAGDNLVTSKWQPHDVFSWIVEFANNTIKLGVDKDFHKQVSISSQKGIPSWDHIGSMWNDILLKVFASPS